MKIVMCKRVFSLGMIFVSYCSHLFSILDGRISPIYLESRYSFTNFEWARGRVYFKNGFDLPINGTAILDILDEPVDGDIVFRNSTLLMQRHLKLGRDVTITGSGFIKGEGNTLFVESSIVMGDTDRFIFTSSITLEGRLYPGLRPRNISFTEGVTEFVLKNMTLQSAVTTHFFTESLKPASIVFDNSKINFATEFASNLTLNSSLVYLRRENFFDGFPGSILTISEMLEIGGALYVAPQMNLKVNAIRVRSAPPILTLDNAKLSYVFTGTSGYLFTKAGSTVSTVGKFIVKGKSELEAPLGSELLVHRLTSFIMEAGSRFELSPGIKLKIL